MPTDDPFQSAHELIEHQAAQAIDLFRGGVFLVVAAIALAWAWLLISASFPSESGPWL